MTTTHLYLLFIPTIIFVYLYNKIPKRLQILNKKLFLNVCGWNILHTIAFFTLSYFIKLQTIEQLFELIIFMVAWFVFELITYNLVNKLSLISTGNHKCEEKKVYCNPYIPRLDDFAFNFLGVILYISIFKNYKKK